MIALTGKQKRHLRSLGQRLSVGMTIGKAGLGQATLDHLQPLLAKNELVKVRLGEEYTGAARKDAAGELELATEACCVGIVGRTVLLYRPSETLPDKKRIHLPK